ncbi:GPI anchored protein-like protein [Boeremia exigua]|uniref:GPI anchored protein-like protein n=1 Tax=Boeremia exigua TaxID=749465 RepID=UPI001E8D6531|nr:GPI anchored protein-like protein [Boeremia exigua]KAH6612169.1 GPI anchored protein-like protein [Boeremia exigua]
MKLSSSVLLTCGTLLQALSTNADPVLEVTSLQHPGALHTLKDIERVRLHVEKGDQPWARAYQHLQAGSLAQPTRKPNPQQIVVRGQGNALPQNYATLYRDIHSAYQLALRYQISQDATYGAAAAGILDAWAATLQRLDGSADRFLAAGIYGYQFANVGELLVDFPGWPKANQTAFGQMLNTVFATVSQDFLINHNGAPAHYYANWDLCNIAGLMAIGIFTDNTTMFNYASAYFANGPAGGAVSFGALPFFSIANLTEAGSGKSLMQTQETGRDQGHTLLDFALLAVIGQQGLSQGIDLFGLYGNQILAGSEYAAKYNVGEDVPYVPYKTFQGTFSVISNNSRSGNRPGFEGLYAHYATTKGLNASWTGMYRDQVNLMLPDNIEGGGGDYGTSSGGFDSLGHGTLMYRL